MCTRNRFQSRQSLDHKRANKSFNWESPPPHHYHPPTTPKTTRPVSWLALSLSQWYKFRVYSVSGDGMCVCGTSMAITLYLCTIDNNKYNLWLPRCLRIPKLPPFCLPSSFTIPLLLRCSFFMVVHEGRQQQQYIDTLYIAPRRILWPLHLQDVPKHTADSIPSLRFCISLVHKMALAEELLGGCMVGWLVGWANKSESCS